MDRLKAHHRGEWLSVLCATATFVTTSMVTRPHELPILFHTGTQPEVQHAFENEITVFPGGEGAAAQVVGAMEEGRAE
jgi:hypothetical protein